MNFKVKDHYYNKAKKEKFLARSIYKLEEIDKKYSVLKRGDLVLDLGYYPGSWIQYTSKKVGDEGKVLGIDIQPVNESLLSENNVRLWEMDAFELSDVKELEIERKFNVVLSDMAPKTTGIKSVDQIRSLDLVEKVFGILDIFLVPGGSLVVKVFESNDAQVFLKSQKKRFEKINNLRPKSTRSVSKEFFVIAQGFKA